MSEEYCTRQDWLTLWGVMIGTVLSIYIGILIHDFFKLVSCMPDIFENDESEYASWDLIALPRGADAVPDAVIVPVARTVDAEHEVYMDARDE